MLRIALALNGKQKNLIYYYISFIKPFLQIPKNKPNQTTTKQKYKKKS